MKLPGGRSFTAALLALLTVSACVSIPDAGPAASGAAGLRTPGASAPPETPFESELDNVAPDGTRTVDSALKLFAMAYGPLPGVDVPAGDNGDIEGTLARRAVLAHYEELTADQKAAVDKWLAPDPNAPSVIVGPRGQAGGVLARGAGLVADEELTPLQQAIQSATDDYRFAIAAKIGDTPGPIKVTFPYERDLEEDRPDALADADGIWVNGAYTGCEIRWFLAGLTDAPLNMLLTAAHETFHCFQAANIGKEIPYLTGPDWWEEGGAEWVSYDIAGAPQDGGFWWKYVNRPYTTLFERDYDAVGFFADLAASGIDPWDKWKAMWAAYSNEAAWLASGAEADAFLDSWASGWFRDPSRGVAWDMQGPGIPESSYSPQSLSVGNGSNGPFASFGYANADYIVNSTADVLLLTGEGHVRISDGNIDEPQPYGQHFCTKAGGCSCPDGKPPPYPVTNLSPTFYLAVTGGSGDGVTGNVTGIKLEDACKPEEESKAVQVTADRPGADGVLPGNVVTLTSCDGPYGTWKGIFRTGGLDNNGFVVPWTELPVEFTMPAEGGEQTATTTTSAIVHTPIGDVPLDYKVTVTVNGGSMHIVLDPGTDDLDNKLKNLPILPAPAGACPE